MLFSSIHFYVFFLIFAFVYFAFPKRFSLPIIVLGSTFFYGYWNPYYVWIPHFLVLIAFLCCRWFRDSQGATRKRRLTVSIVLLLAPLIFFKYTNFFYHAFTSIFFENQENLTNLPLPLGISFVTFTLISYVVDIYHGKCEEENIETLFSYILFFPQLVAGPILRPKELIPQFKQKVYPNKKTLLLGIAIFSIGLIKKIVFADSIAPAVSQVYDSPAGLDLIDYLIGIYGFTMQIYCDFSGYTDMAVGSALLLGFKLPLNFNKPYIAASLVDFWRRWHMTLSFWLRDYLYIPLGGNRNNKQARNVLITMVLGGLWHGANWTFIAWGAAHGLGIVVAHKFFKESLNKTPVQKWLNVFLTFNFVAFTWVLFRAPDLVTAWSVMTEPLSAPLAFDTLFMGDRLFHIFLIVFFLALHRFDDYSTVERFLDRIPASILWPATSLLWIIIIATGSGESTKFIYFDF